MRRGHGFVRTPAVWLRPDEVSVMRREGARSRFARASLVLLLVGCGINNRTTRIRQLTPDASISPASGGSAGSAGAAGNGGTGGSSSGEPLLGIEPAAIDFGGAVIGSPSRARVTLGNSGTAPLDVPTAVLLPGSDPD